METRDGKVLTSPSQVAFVDQDNTTPTQQPPVVEGEQKQAEKLAAELGPKTEQQAELLAAELTAKPAVESPKSVLQHIFDRTQKR